MCNLLKAEMQLYFEKGREMKSDVTTKRFQRLAKLKVVDLFGLMNLSTCNYNTR